MSYTLPDVFGRPEIPLGRYAFCERLLPANATVGTMRFLRCVCLHYGHYCSKALSGAGAGDMPDWSASEKILDRARLGSELLKVISKTDYEIRLPPTTAAPARESALSLLLRTIAVVLFGSLAALVGLILFTMAVTRLCVHQGCCDDDASSPSAPEEEEERGRTGTSLTLQTLTVPSPRRARSPGSLSRERVSPAHSRGHSPAGSRGHSPGGSRGRSPAGDSPPPYPGRRPPPAPPPQPPREEEPPPSYQEVCEVIHC